MITRLLDGLASRARILYYRVRGIRFEGRCWLRAIEVPRFHGAIRLGDGAALDRGVVLLVTGGVTDTPKITIGRQTYVNRHTIVDASREIHIGAECMIGPHCYITDHDHAISASEAPGTGPLQASPTRIEDRCWVGAHVTILKGVTIGKGTVVGAGSVVTKSLPPGVIAVGNPSRVIRKI